MPRELFNKLSLSRVKFLATLNDGRHSKIYKVEFENRPCVLKVVSGNDGACIGLRRMLHQLTLCKYHRDEPESSFKLEHETNIFLCESRAYRRLKETGLCDKGIVPDFYGVITDIEPRTWDGLKLFHHDRLPVDAILIEYIPGLQCIHLGNHTPEHMETLREELKEINAAGVIHHDIHPRNMAVATEGNVERVMWIDFDRAQTFSLTEPIPGWAVRWFKREPMYFDFWTRPPVSSIILYWNI